MASFCADAIVGLVRVSAWFRKMERTMATIALWLSLVIHTVNDDEAFCAYQLSVGRRRVLSRFGFAWSPFPVQ